MSPTLPNHVAEKACPSCKETKPASEFYPDKHTKSGLNCYCKPCARAKGRRYLYNNLEKVRAKHRELRKDPRHQARMRAARDLDKLKHYDKSLARSRMNNAIKRGKLTRLPCHVCGNPKSQGHHHDYTKPLDVEWLCQQCHGKEHRRTPEGIAARERGV